MSTAPDSIVFAVQSAVLEVLDLIESVTPGEVPERKEGLRDEAQRTILMFVAAIVIAKRDYNPAQQSFLSLLVDCQNLPGGEARYLNDYAVRWVEASKQKPEFFDVALRYDASHRTDIARNMLRQFQLIGTNVCASDGHMSTAGGEVVQHYIAFLEESLEASKAPPIVVSYEPSNAMDDMVLRECIPPVQVRSGQFISGRVLPRKRNAELRWVPADESIDIGGFCIPSAMIYVSDGQPSTAEASAIDLTLQVGRTDREPRSPLNYYPRYTWLSPDQRAVYLQWLAAGRHDEDPASRELGYIFLFFYGLERRLLIDKGQEQEMVAEIVRLLHHYGTYVRSRSLQSYACQLVHFWGWKQGERYYAQLLEWMKTLPVSLLGQDELAIVLASQFQSNTPLSVDLGYELASRDLSSRRSVVVSRVNREFRELFGKRYLETFPTGINLRCSKRPARLQYRPASPTLLYGASSGLSIEVPDVLGLPSQFKQLPDLWNACVNDLNDYSRARSKTGASSGNLKAYQALPEELRAGVVHPLAKSWETIIAGARAGKDCALIDVGALSHLLDIPQREKLTPGQSRDLAQVIESLGFVVEPDARYESAYAWDQELAVFKSGGTTVAAPSPSYLGASVLLKLCVFVAGADGHVAPEELDVSRRFVETKLSLSPEDHRRLEALEQILVADPTRVGGSLARIAKPVPKEQRELICEVLVYVAAADSIVTKDEIRTLERIFRAFELPVEKLEAHLKSISPGLGEVTVQERGSQVAGEMIPRPGQSFHIDMSRVDHIAQETSEVIGILSKVMADEEPGDARLAQNEKTQSDAVTSGPSVTGERGLSSATPDRLGSLEPKYRPVLLHLIEQGSCSRADFDALAKKFQLMPLDAFDAINGWADENLGDFLLEGEGTILVHKELMP